MREKIKQLSQNNPAAWQFIKYSFFCGLAGITETVLFVLLNYLLPANGVNASFEWFIFSYPSEAGGVGALIAFVCSSVAGQTLAFITNFKNTFQSTNNVWLSAVGFVILALLTIIGIHTYLGGVLNTALCKAIPNPAIAGAIAKISCQISSFLLSFPINKYILMRRKPSQSPVG
ncbi:MAG: hypothetical protein ACOYIQ_04530 [Christensenellales bacterium]|jgi:putative flippase GtrA